MFFEHADEERQHGLKFIEYLRMRGYNQNNLFNTGFGPVLGKSSWENGEEALKDALTMEKLVKHLGVMRDGDKQSHAFSLF